MDVRTEAASHDERRTAYTTVLSLPSNRITGDPPSVPPWNVPFCKPSNAGAHERRSM
jgi:hypothetical protein